jgi:hypothetical protein
MEHDDFNSYYASLMDYDCFKQITNLYRQQDLSLCAYGFGEYSFVMAAYMQQDV